MDWPIPCQRQGAGGRQPEPERGKLGPRDGIPYQTANRLPVSKQDILGFWMVDIRWEGHSQRSAPHKRHTRHTGDGHSQGHPGIQTAGTAEVIRCNHCLRGVSSQAHGHLSFSDWGRAQNAGPTESAPLWSLQEPEPEWLRPGKCRQPRARFRQFPCRTTWSLSSVDWESTHSMSRGKPSVAGTLRALPMHTSDICLQWSSLPTAQLNK